MSDQPTLLPPRANPLLSGHEAAERMFLDAWHGGRLAHAWMIAGPRGIGKATLAFRIARFVLNGGRTEPPGLFGDSLPADNLKMAAEEPVFRRIASGGHADLKVIELPTAESGKKRKDIPADLVRTVPEFMSMTAAEGGWRVVIVDALDELNRYGANALLKSVEEPPKNTLVLLVTHNPAQVLPTIRSRCRLLRLSPLTEAIVADLLATAQPDMSETDRAMLTRLSGGSIGRALALAEAGGATIQRDIDGLLGGLPRLDNAKLHDFADKMGRGEETLRLTGELVGDWLAARATGRAGFGSQPGVGLDRWVELWDKSRRLVAQADGLNLDRKQAILSIFFALERHARQVGGAAAGEPT